MGIKSFPSGCRADRFEDEILFGARRARQHIVDDFGFVAGVAYAQPHPPNGLADMRNDIAHAVVAAVAAAVLQPHRANR
jgi:hypothetical protein